MKLLTRSLCGIDELAGDKKNAIFDNVGSTQLADLTKASRQKSFGLEGTDSIETLLTLLLFALS
jgi:hypothetical protein